MRRGVSGRVRFLVGAAVLAAALAIRSGTVRRLMFRPAVVVGSHGPEAPMTPFQARLAAELMRQVRADIRYHDAYYVGGEPPPSEGVCTDVVVRALRAGGVDLRAEVAADVRAHASAYRIDRPDANIDHRRCRNLIVFFRRRAEEPSSDADWEPGDIVLWCTAGDDRVDHIGMVGAHLDRAGHPTVVHHWPGCPVRETADLHAFKIAGHFRWRERATGREQPPGPGPQSPRRP